jgi:hypothetical protein
MKLTQRLHLLQNERHCGQLRLLGPIGAGQEEQANEHDTSRDACRAEVWFHSLFNAKRRHLVRCGPSAARNRDNATLRYNEHAVGIAWGNGRRSGQFPERGQHGMTVTEPEAREPHALPAASLEGYRGVDVSAENVAARKLLRMVSAKERTKLNWIRGDRQVIRLEISATDVVVPHRKDHLDVRVALTPRSEAFAHPLVPSPLRVPKISEEHEPGNAESLNETREIRKCGGRAAFRHRISRRSESGALSKMKISYEQRGRCRPIQRLFGECR